MQDTTEVLSTIAIFTTSTIQAWREAGIKMDKNLPFFTVNRQQSGASTFKKKCADKVNKYGIAELRSGVYEMS